MNSPQRARLAFLPAVAAAGLLAGHRLTYLGLAPSEQAAEAWLSATGHGYIELAGITSLALALMAGLYFLALGCVNRLQAAPGPASTMTVLSSIQLIGFGAQEVLERLAAGVPLHDLGTVLLFGAPVQLLVAAVASLLVIGLHKAGSILSRLLAAPRPRGSALAPTRLRIDLVPPLGVTPTGRLTRGPPSGLSWT